MTSLPLVSILINNYNYARFLPESIESALNQTYPKIEVVVVDDGSTDPSREIILRYGELANREESGRLVPVLKDNGGQASAFNAGIAASRGEILCFLDADDYFAPDKVEKIVAHFLDHPGAGWLFHELDDVDAAGSLLPPDGRSTVTQFEAVDFRLALKTGDCLPHLPATTGLCFRRETLLQVQQIPPEIRIASDNFLRLSSACVAPGLLVPERLAVHRMHGKNLYERRTDVQWLHAETDMKTAYHLRRQFPQAQRFCDRLFAHAFGQLVGRDGLQPVFQVPEAKAYLQRFLGLGNGPSFGLRIAYNYLRATKAAA